MLCSMLTLSSSLLGDYSQGIGNGLPLAAVVTTPEVASVLTKHLHFNTFGGNPVCSAGGHAVLKVVDKDKLQENSAVVGGHLLGRLRDLQEKHSGNVSAIWSKVGISYLLGRKHQNLPQLLDIDQNTPNFKHFLDTHVIE